MNKYADKIKCLRKKRKLTQFQVAKGSGITIKTLFRYEHGIVKRCNRKTLEKIADFYGVEVEDIWEESDYEEK